MVSPNRTPKNAAMQFSVRRQPHRPTHLEVRDDALIEKKVDAHCKWNTIRAIRENDRTNLYFDPTDAFLHTLIRTTFGKV